MIMKCDVCGFFGNEEIFEVTVMEEDETGNGLHEEKRSKCPFCGEVDTEDDDSNIDVMELDGREWGKSAVIEYLINDHMASIEEEMTKQVTSSITLEEMLRNGFKGYEKMTCYQLTKCLSDEGNVIEDAEYIKKYGKVDVW